MEFAPTCRAWSFASTPSVDKVISRRHGLPFATLSRPVLDRCGRSFRVNGSVNVAGTQMIKELYKERDSPELLLATWSLPCSKWRSVMVCYMIPIFTNVFMFVWSGVFKRTSDGFPRNDLDMEKEAGWGRAMMDR